MVNDENHRIAPGWWDFCLCALVVLVIGFNIGYNTSNRQMSDKRKAELGICDLPDGTAIFAGFVPTPGLQMLKMNVNKTIPFESYSTFSSYQKEFDNIECMKVFNGILEFDKILYLIGKHDAVVGYIGENGNLIQYAMEWDIDDKSKCNRILQFNMNQILHCNITLFEISQIYPNSQRSCATQRTKDDMSYYIEYNTSDCSKENLLGIKTI